MFKQSIILVLALTACASVSKAVDRAPRIVHEPVKAAVKGQPIYIRATVTDDTGPAESVNLYCSISSDSAPFKVPMRASGAGAFIGTIPKTLIQSVSKVAYYIEAFDSLDQSTETPWYTINFRSHTGKKEQSSAGDEKKSSWKKPLLITAGAAAAVGAGFAIAGSGGSDDNNDTAQPEDNGGLFAGSATKYSQVEGGELSAETYSIVFNVINNTTISSDNLHPGVFMQTAITDGSFTLVGPVSEEDLTGSISYSGSIAGSQIAGNISGSAVTSSGTNTTYSGSFRADKQ